MDGLLIILYILLGYNANQYLRRTIILYILLGYNANQYLRRTLLGQVGVIYFNTGYYIIREIVLAAFLGMFTIPLAIIVFAFKTFLSGNK